MQEREHWEDLNVNGKYIKMDLKKVGLDGLDSSGAR
jgi:hypothetical protein